MKIAYLYFSYDPEIRHHEDYLNSDPRPHLVHKQLKQDSDLDITVVQRSAFESTHVVDGVKYYFITDEFSNILRWWQEPKSSIAVIKKLNLDILQVAGLNLPLQFRWLRRQIGHNITIIGQHTGETIWANRKIWLQQFGLRVVDGFIFANESDKYSWIKAAVILPRQTIYIIPYQHNDLRKTVRALLKIYSTMDY